MNFDHPLIEVAYLLSAILFVVGLKRLQSPATARGGNALAALAMLVAIIATMRDCRSATITAPDGISFSRIQARTSASEWARSLRKA